MAESVKYLTIVSEMISLYQKELIKFMKKYPLQIPNDFKKVFHSCTKKLKIAETQKSISDQISALCEPMQKFLEQPQRPNKTSLQQRKALKSQVGDRKFRMTAAFTRQNRQTIAEDVEYNDIIQSYRIEQQIVPRMRMKWMSPHLLEQPSEPKQDTIGNNNINMLSYTIPEIQNSIRRLSVRRSPKSIKERQLDLYRSLQSRSMRKKYINRLI